MSDGARARAASRARRSCLGPPGCDPTHTLRSGAVPGRRLGRVGGAAKLAAVCRDPGAGDFVDRGAASSSALEDAISVEQVAQAALRESLAEVRRAQDDLTKKVIRAPLAGVLRSFDVEEGEYVRSGQPLGELLDLERAKVRIGLSDREVVAVRSGQAVRMQLEAYPEETFQAEIARVGAAWDVDTRKFPVEIEIDNPDGRLLPGMIAEVSFYLGEASTVQVIPRDAALKEFGLRFIYVVASAPDGSQLIARKRRITVRPMPFRPAEFEVLTGLSDGEEIATSGVSGLHDGDAVSRIGDAG